VATYFERIENGPLVFSAQRSPRSSTAAWLKAAQERGYRIEEPNQPAPEGFCKTVVTQRRGARWSSADAYLKPALGRKNLTLLTEATATRVLFEGTRAVGVEFERHGQHQVVRARREVVLSGGTINSPQLLMLSGIGDRDHLTEHGIDVVHHAPEIGKNLTDHLYAPLGFEVKNDTLFAADKPRQLINYIVRRRGMLTSNGCEAYGFVRSRPDLKLPDLELMFLPAPYFDEGIGDPYPGHSITFGPILLRPQSRGTITLRSPDPHDKPIIDPQYLSDDASADRTALMAGLRICANLVETPALRDVTGKIARPLHATTLDDHTLERALNTCAHSTHHQVGTYRMGRDATSVVDPQLRVRGVDGLRVADASVMPTTIRGHTHAPAVLIGEKAADLIRA
jgi:choline dehydrogenase